MSASSAAPSRPLVSRVNPNAVLAVVAVAQFMVILDATVVNVALPTIRRHLGFSEQNLSWVLNSYTLMFGGFLLLGGRAADRLGPRPVFGAGWVLGGGIVQAVSWRWVFFINVPIGAVVLGLTPRIVPESRSDEAAGRGY